MKYLYLFFSALFLNGCSNQLENVKKAETKPRTIITTDGEIDDVDSFIRMLLYSNEFEIEGLIYSSSMWHYKGDAKGTLFTSEMPMTQMIYNKPRPELRWPGVNWMQDLLKAYEEVHPNLIKHESAFPTADRLRNLIKVGNIDFEGEMDKITEGSEWIKVKLLDGNPAQIYLQAWGGTNTIARALKSIQEEYENSDEWKEVQKRVSSKAIIYTIMDQDATLKNFVSKNWPDITVLYNARQFGVLAYNWKKAVPPALQTYFDGKFMDEKIINNHGPLTKMYYSYGDGQKQAGDEEHIHGDPSKMKNGQWGSFEKYDFLSEGDSPAFLHLIDVGLDNLKNPNYGGWGGRLKESKTIPARWDDSHVAEFNTYTDTLDASFAQVRWLAALQNDFASRADWCVKSFEKANHPPVIVAKVERYQTVLPGESVRLEVLASDPDKNELTTSFWQYKEVGTCKADVKLSQNKNQVLVEIPKDAQSGSTIHIIAQADDNGSPSLTRYQRFVLTLK